MATVRMAASRRSISISYQALIAIFAAFFLCWVIVRPGGDSGAVWFSDITLTLASATAGIVTLSASLSMTGSARTSWILIAAGILSWAFGISAWSYYELVLNRETPFPSLADLGYLGMIPLMFAGLVTLPTNKPIASEARIKVALDAILIMASIATVSWYVLIGPIYTNSQAALLEKLIGLAYPASDLVLLFAVIGGIARGWASGRNPALLALVAGIILFIVADTGFAFLTLHDAYVSGNPIDLGWPLGLLLVSYAAVQRWSASEDLAPVAVPTGEGPIRALLRQLAPYVLVMGVAALLFYSRFAERGVFHNVFVGASLVTVMLVMVRQFVTVRENENMARELRSISEDLESKVVERTARLSALHRVASALSSASSVEEVTRVALNAAKRVAGGAGAAFYLRSPDLPEEFACQARLRAVPTIDPDQLRTLVDQVTPATVTELSPGRTAVHLPVAARGHAYGVIVVTGVGEESPVDEQSLLTIASEFGVAYENQRRYLEVRELADRDPVTGLFNHRYFHKELAAHLEENRQAAKPFGVVIMDIDDFKLFNDTYGHPKGDAVLKLMASGLLEATKKKRMVAARFGGDEFAVLLPECNRQSTIEFMRQFREWVQVQSYHEKGCEQIPIRISFGCAVFPEDGKRAYEIVAAADSSLYDAKRAGGFVPRGDKTMADFAEKGGSFKMLEGLITAVDNKDQYTKAHCDLVAEYAVAIAEAMSLSQDVQRSLAIAGALHDVGKICIPDRILRKPGSLSDEEYETVKMHVPLASSLIQHVPRRRDVLDAVMNHHERYDGSGYPKGLQGKAIPFVGRIISVADAFSAMTLDRPYRKALPLEHAIDELNRNAGGQFDPEIVEVFVKALQRQLVEVVGIKSRPA